MTQSKTILLAEDSPQDVELTLTDLKQSNMWTNRSGFNSLWVRWNN